MSSAVRSALLSLSTLLVFAGLLAGTALAQGPNYLGGKVRTGDVVTIPSSETVRGDLYVFARMLNVDGTIEGDLVAFASQINISGTVNGSVLAASGTLTMGGQARGAVRAAAGQVTIDGGVGRDAAIAAGQLTTGSAAKIGQDVIFATGATSLGGTVTGSVLGTASTYTRSGTLGGTEQVEISRTDSGDQPVTPVGPQPIPDALRQFVAVLLAGGLLLWLRPRILTAWDTLLRAEPALTLGYGLLALIVFVAAVVVAFIAIIVLAIIFGILSLGPLVAIDVIGGLLLVSVGVFAFVVVCAIVVDAIVGYAVGRAILQTAQLGQWQTVLQLALGALIVVAIEALPVIGGIAKLAVVLFGLGVLTLYAWRARGRLTPTAARAAA